jgi:hypothetical protein
MSTCLAILEPGPRPSATIGMTIGIREPRRLCGSSFYLDMLDMEECSIVYTATLIQQHH